MKTEIELQVSQPLLKLMESCETFCIAGCCGTDAFDVSEKQINEWVKTVGVEQTDLASKQLNALIEEVTLRDTKVTSDRFNACWSALECVGWLNQWRIALDEVSKSFDRK